MKKLNYLVLGLGAFIMASCSQDDLTDLSTGDGNFHITVSLPRDMATRAFGEGKASTTLDYAIYDVTNNQEPQFSFQDKATFPEGSLTTTLNLNLIEGKSYRIAFFASAPNNGVYTFSPSSDTPNISVNYAAMTGEGANSDLYDCFFKMTDAIAITGNLAPQSVTLERPVAQINWGTKDMYSNPEIEKAWGTTQETSYIQSNLTVTGKVYQQLNILTGELDETTLTEIEIFKNNQEAAPTGIGFPVDPTTYNYVACQYLLAPASPNATYSLTLNINNTNNSTIKKQIQVDNAPLQANYRTNIYGNLLSTNTTFTVTKSADWSNFNIIVEPTKPNYNAETNAYEITTEGELKWIAQQINAPETGLNTRAAEDVTTPNPQTANYTLMNDIYLTTPWTPIGLGYNHWFGGTFDGQNYTIYNMNVSMNTPYTDPLWGGAGFFGWFMGTVKNLNFDGASVTTNHWGAVIAGYSNNGGQNPSVIYNCHIKNSSVTLTYDELSNGEWDNADKGGMIAGYMLFGSITDCSVTNCNVTGYREIGGIAGYSQSNTITNNTVNGLTINVNNSHNYKNYKTNEEHNANPIVGKAVSLKEDSGNNSSDICYNYYENL